MSTYTDDERHLLTHCRAMGGWLTIGYMYGGRVEAAASLARRGLVVMGRGEVYGLTAEGAAQADELAGMR